MITKEYVQILNDKEQLRQKILELSTNAPETYKAVFEKISRDKNGLADPADSIEIARVWFSGIAFAFNAHSIFYADDVERLVNEAPKGVSIAFDLPQLDAMIEHLNETILTLKSDLSKYLTLDVDKIRLREELQARRAEHLSQETWLKKIEDRDREKRVREYQQIYECPFEELFKVVEALCSKYSQKTGMGGTIEGNRDFYFINQSLIPYWVFQYETDTRLGHYIFLVEKLYTFNGDDLFLDPDVYEVVPELADGAGFYREIGHITISQTLDVNLSMISTKTENADLLDFFKSLLEEIKIPKKASLVNVVQTIKSLPEPKRPLKVFLCHAHADSDPVRGLYSRLTQDGVDAWLDKEKLLPGQDWELEIRKAVREADVVVVCLSKQFNQAGFRQKEVRLALDTAMEKPEGEIFIIPARLEECDTLESLRKWNWVDLFEDDGYKMLIRAFRARVDKNNVIPQTREIKQKSFSDMKIKKPIKENWANRSLIDSWVNYVCYDWLNRREIHQFRSSTAGLIKKMNQLVSEGQLDDALNLIDRLETLQKNFTNDGINETDSFFVYLECAIAAYRISESGRARKLLIDGISFTANLHDKAVAYWLLGCVCWYITEVDDAILSWERGLNAFRESAIRYPKDSTFAAWYSEKIGEMSDAIEYAAEHDLPPLPKPYRKAVSKSG